MDSLGDGISGRISEGEIARLMQAFNKHDADRDGVITTAELGQVRG